MTHFRSFVFPAICIFALLVSAISSCGAVTFTNTPSAVSNTYNGTITLQIGGLTNGETVVVQKFLDANTNGVIGAGDLLIQQFRLTDGQGSVFTNGTIAVTNFDVPGDTDSTTGEISAPLNFQNGDFAQTLVGKFLYKLSSPSGHFAPVTNLFTVTNAFYPQLVTGMVENATSFAAVSNALVFLLTSQNGALNVKAGAVANNSGYFSLRVPPGTFWLAAAKSNFVFDLSSAQSLNATTNSQTNNFTLNLTPATTNILGKFVDATNSSGGLAGILGIAQSTNDLLSIFFTDTNGNFAAPVTSNSWAVLPDDFAAAFDGYLTAQTNFLIAVSNKVVHVTNSLAKATAIFYGNVKDNFGNPMSGVFLSGSDNLNHLSSAMTDGNGNYFAGALAGTWQFGVAETNNPGLTNFYVFSPGSIQTNVNAGQAILQNFILEFAPFYINGYVKDIDGNPIVGVQIFATADIGGTNYQAASAWTDANGNYSLNVCAGDWTVDVSPNSLQSLGYTNSLDQSTNISYPGGTVNFQISLCGEIGIITSTNLPDGAVGSPYAAELQASSCYPVTNWSTAYGVTLTSLYDQTNVTYPAGTTIYFNPSKVGYLLTDFSYGIKNDSVYWTNITFDSEEQTGPGTVEFDNIAVTVNVSAPIMNTNSVTINKKKWTAQPTTQSGATYTTVLTRKSDTFTDGDNPQNYTATNGMLMTNTVTYPVTTSKLNDLFRSLTLGSSLNSDLESPYTNADNSIVWIGNAQYLISAFGPQTTNLPPGINLIPDGTYGAMLLGTPTTNGTFNFTVRVVDVASNSAIQTFSLFIYPATTLGAAANSSASSTNGQFEMQVNGIAGQNYTLQMTTNLASTNWVSIFTTNSPDTNSFDIIDPNATNPSRFYRLLIGP